MAIATEQLEAIQQEIEQSFSADSAISVVPLDGNPPDKYEVTYQVNGLQKSDSGAVENKNQHTISISIPFGFPHFPPSCKPKSPIFHPDFDPAAICIGDFWEKNRSISDLISHIGEMIEGRFYSTSNAFNEEAAQWYADNQSKLSSDSQPESVAGENLASDSPQPASTAPADAEDITSLLDDDEDGLSPEDDWLEPYDSSEEVDIAPALSFVDAPEDTVDSSAGESLDGIFEESDFDFQQIDQQSEAVQEPTPIQPEFGDDLKPDESEEEVDVDHLLALADQKRFFGLSKELSLLPGTADFEEKAALSELAKSASEQVKSIYAEAMDLEHQGKPAEALKRFKQIETLVTDYPALNEDINRTTQAIELLGDWTKPVLEKAPPEEPAQKQEAPRKTAAPIKKESPEKKQEDRTFFDDGTRRSSRIIPYALLVVVLLIAAGAGFNYYLTASKYQEAQQMFAHCQASLKKDQFSAAEQQCEAAVGVAKQILIFKSSERDTLIRQIQTTLKSEPLKQGLAGNLILDGQYHPKQVVETILAFRQFKKSGDELFAASDWHNSVSNYQQALEIGRKEKAIDRQQIFEISENIKVAQFNIIYQSGISYIEGKKWVLATKDLSAALDQLKALSIPGKDEKIESITASLAGIAQATEKEKGDIAFQEAQWEIASSHYKKALDSAATSTGANSDSVYELKQLVVKADLYATISSGKDAFRKAQWDSAISSYDQAIKILESNREVLKQANTDENRKKLARIMLQASVIRDQQDAARHLKEGEYQAATKQLEAIRDSIATSEFGSEPEFVAVMQEAEQAIAQAETDRLLADKITYLEENFEELFTRHYSGSPPESLTERTVVFEKELDGKLLFRLQCVEVGRGRPLQLVMKYAHDLSSGEWKFYSDSK